MPIPPRRVLPVVALAVLLLSPAPAGADDDPADRYREAAGRILGRALVDEGAWTKLEHLTTRIGPRLSGSPGLEKAIAWAHEAMKAEGLEGVRGSSRRGCPGGCGGASGPGSSSPVERELPMLGLGMSVGTPEEGITAPVVVVRSFEELDSARATRRSRAGSSPSRPTGRATAGRCASAAPGASAAAKLGAVAALVRSATGRSIASPHTGMLELRGGGAEDPGGGDHGRGRGVAAADGGGRREPSPSRSPWRPGSRARSTRPT